MIASNRGLISHPVGVNARARRVVTGILAVPVGLVALTTGVGCCVFSMPGYRGPKSDHFDGKHFHNEIERKEPGVGDMIRWGLDRHPGPWRTWTDAPPGPPPPKRVEGGRLRVTFINHATVLIQMDGVNILTDPIYSERPSPLAWAGPRRVRPPGIRFEDLPPIDAVLVSHAHYDHLDVPTLQRLVRERHPRFFAGLGTRTYLDTQSIGSATDLDWWQSAELAPGVSVIAVPSQHFSNRSVCDARRALWEGFVIRGPSGAVYFAGDTAMGPHFAEIAERMGPIRLAILPIGAFRPEWFMGSVHMSPTDAVMAHEILRASTSVAMHFGTFPLGDDGEDEAPRELEKAVAKAGEPRPRFWVLGFGEGRDVPPDPRVGNHP